MSDEYWRPTFQTTVDAFYQGKLSEGREACKRLLSVADLPKNIDLLVRRNAIFYAPPLAEIAPSTVRQRVAIDVPEGWSRFNPSIAADPASDGFQLIIRSSNYTMSRQLRYTIHDQGGVIRTTNYCLTLSSDLAVRDIASIDDAAFRIDPPPFPVSGFEDCRLFWHRGAWWVSATVRDRAASGVCQIALLRLDGATACEIHFLSDGVSRHEKNWMPAPDASDDILRFIYTCHPTVVTRYDDDAGVVVPEHDQPGPLIARRFSGGSQAIPLDGGRLCLVHEAVNFPDGGRVYTHRWVWFDSVWRLAKLSAPFFLQERGIEFAGGLAQRGDDLVISYGFWDREAWLATVPVAEVLPLLAPPLAPDEVEAEMRETAAVIAPTVEIPAAAPQIESDPSATVLKSDDAPIPDEEPWADGITPFTAPTATIVSTTLTGNSREVIGDALRSVVDWVDWVLVIDTGVTDDTLEIARQIAGDKLILRQFAWRDDFSAARNFALEAAAETGATWAVTLDTDERIDPGAIDIRTFLAETDADSLHVKQANGTYGKERFFRLPVRGQYVGPTHEAFIKVGGSATLEGVHFKELGKTHEHYRQKAERDAAILARHTAAHPDDPRWFYYLGDSLAGLGRHDEAIAAFRVCASLKGWDEEGAWAMYRAAQSLFQLGRTEEAIEACAVGMSRHAGLAELPWMAAYYTWQSGRPAQAAYWARQAAAMGHFAGAGATVPRIGFRHPPGLWEGPYDVLRFALRALGDESGANEAQRLYDEARMARERALRADVDVNGHREPHQHEQAQQTESKPYTPSYFADHREETRASANAIGPGIAVREFTVHWFDYHRGHLTSALAPFRGQPGVRMLEIGAYEGRSTVWFLEEILTGDGSHLTSVDTWEGSAENDPNEMHAVWERFRRNTQEHVAAGKLTVVVSRSQPFLAGQIARGETSPGQGYHLIYVDGSHAAPDVLSDAVLSWALLEPGGIMVFDDYVWSGMTTEQERPRIAIDSFLDCFLGQYDELHRGVQIVIRRHDSAMADRPEGMLAAVDDEVPAAGGVTDEANSPLAPTHQPGPQRRRRGKHSRG